MHWAFKQLVTVCSHSNMIGSDIVIQQCLIVHRAFKEDSPKLYLYEPFPFISLLTGFKVPTSKQLVPNCWQILPETLGQMWIHRCCCSDTCRNDETYMLLSVVSFLWNGYRFRYGRVLLGSAVFLNGAARCGNSYNGYLLGTLSPHTWKTVLRALSWRLEFFNVSLMLWWVLSVWLAVQATVCLAIAKLWYGLLLRGHVIKIFQTLRKSKQPPLSLDFHNNSYQFG